MTWVQFITPRCWWSTGVNPPPSMPHLQCSLYKTHFTKIIIVCIYTCELVSPISSNVTSTLIIAIPSIHVINNAMSLYIYTNANRYITCHKEYCAISVYIPHNSGPSDVAISSSTGNWMFWFAMLKLSSLCLQHASTCLPPCCSHDVAQSSLFLTHLSWHQWNSKHLNEVILPFGYFSMTMS